MGIRVYLLGNAFDRLQEPRMVVLARSHRVIKQLVGLELQLAPLQFIPVQALKLGQALSILAKIGVDQGGARVGLVHLDGEVVLDMLYYTVLAKGLTEDKLKYIIHIVIIDYYDLIVIKMEVYYLMLK